MKVEQERKKVEQLVIVTKFSCDLRSFPMYKSNSFYKTQGRLIPSSLAEKSNSVHHCKMSSNRQIMNFETETFRQFLLALATLVVLKLPPFCVTLATLHWRL
jgi:hypothetical protein